MIELCLEKRIADYPVPQSILDKVGLSCAIPTIGNPPVRSRTGPTERSTL